MSNTAVQPATIYLKDYQAPAFTITDVQLTFVLEEEGTTVTSVMEFKRNRLGSNQVRLNGEELELQSIQVDGVKLAPTDYTQTKTDLSFLAPSDHFSVQIVTLIKPQENTALEGLYKSSGNFCTQCEAEGFRKITYYLDRPDVMASFTTTIIGDGTKYPVMLSNGNLDGHGLLNDGRQFYRWVDPHPKPAYLFALVAGDLARVDDEFTTMSGRTVALQIFVEKGNEDKCDHAMQSLKKSMKWDEEKYGREYDLDIFMIVAVSDFNMGAMENKGLNVFNSKYVLASRETATDADFDGIESVIAHEYFHNWTGNRITCRDWFQLTLKEGLTVFRDQQFSADMNSAPVKRIEDVQRLRAAQFPEDAGPLAHPIQPQSYVEINNFYTATVYEKGAEVIRMLHTLLGAEKFRKGMDLYFERHDGEAVTTEEFIAALEDGSGVDLKQFRRWYIQPGTPEISVTERYDQANQTYVLVLTQKNKKAGANTDPLHIPLKIGLLDKDGNDLLPEDTLLDFREKTQEFRFENIAEKPVPSLFRGFSAPVKLGNNPGDAALDLLFKKDSDPFNRWEAGQRLATNMLLEQIETFATTSAPSRPSETFISAFAELIADNSLDPAFRASALSLPGETYIGQQMLIVDVDAIHQTRKLTARYIGERFEEALLNIYENNHEIDTAGARQLKNAALSYLCATERGTYTKLASKQYAQARSMTDRVAAIARLVNTAGTAREEALADFYSRWEGDALVIDKWFSLQAMATREDTMNDVRALMKHPSFTMLNPNRVRSLIGVFASANPVHFHAKNGDGYAFLADRIIDLNKTNPQIGARFVSPLGQWRRYDKDRQGLMKEQLQRILETPELSKHIYEMVNKSLNNS
ncbi:aminopeptidase N [Sneathiella aquimaris]|uniref:aminopeptidase N n=1 Tax=Sneathiella aquimaris TaxID=2599305 RepID=UPI00146A0106|nr:aminopeptidase N [Sneathiella aquimaris]